MKEFEAKVRLNEENGGKTGELDIMSPPPFDKGYFNGVTYGITFKEHVFEAFLKYNKPSRTWIAKNEYRRGWHDAITMALSEGLKIHVGNETFDMVQKETLIGLGLSMDSALGVEPYSETEESYPEPDRPHGEWEKYGGKIETFDIEGKKVWGQKRKCTNCGFIHTFIEDFFEFYSFCPNCGLPMNEKALEILHNREGDRNE